MAVRRYSLAQRLIHWIVAIVVLCSLTLGMILNFYGFEGLRDGFGLPVTNFIYKYHKTLGIIVLALMTLRLAVRWRRGKPAFEPPLTRFEAVASEAVQTLLYAALLTQPLFGWMATAAGGFPVEFFDWTLPAPIGKDEALSKTLYGIHRAVGWLIVALIVVHVGGALRHWLIKRDTVIQRMSLF